MKTDPRRQAILLIDLGASMGGVEAYLQALAEVLSTHAQLFALCTLPELRERLCAQGVTVVRIPTFARLRILRFLAAAALTVYLVLRHDIGVVQINGLLESILLLLARLLGAKTVYTRHGPFELELYRPFRQPHKYFPRLLARYIAHLATRLVCVSETVGELCAPYFPPHQLAVIPNWVATLPAPRPTTLPTRPVRILCVSRLEEYKGIQHLLAAVRDLPNAEVTIVGDGSYRPQLEAHAPAQVTFAGFHSDPNPFYMDADIFVMPSLGPEGLPMVALEGMSHSLACIFSDLRVHAEITGNGAAALLFPHGDVPALRAALERFLADPALRQNFGKSARRRIAARYAEPAARKAYLQLFQSLHSHTEPSVAT